VRIEQKEGICSMKVSEKQLTTLKENNRQSRNKTRLYIQEALLELMKKNE